MLRPARFWFPVIFFSAIIFFSCSSNEIGNSKDVNPDAIYFEYKIWGEEKDSLVTVLLQYRMGGKNGTTLLPSSPAVVKLDGEALVVDSARLTGAFYEKQFPIKQFAGKHQISFVNLKGKEHKEEFSFEPFELVTKLDSQVKRGKMIFELSGLSDGDSIRVIAVDTAFESNDINDFFVVKNGRITIPEAQLKNLVNGPVSFEFFKEEERELRNPSREGGKILVTYELRRETVIIDD